MSFALMPVEGEEFIDRKEMIKEIVDTLSDKNTRIGFALYGKRRVGKTSILLETRRRLNESDFVVPVYFSIWDLVENTVEEFAKKLSLAILESYKPRLLPKHKTINLIKQPFTLLKDLLKEVNLSIKLKEDIEFFLTFKKDINPKTDNGALIDAVFSLSEQLAKETNTRCILMIDEFPSLVELKNGSKIGESIIRKIRTICETSKHTVLCISGSIRKTMEITVISSTSAFYRQLIVKEVKPLNEEYVTLLINMHLKNISDDAIRLLYTFTRGVPFYIQFLGKKLEKLDIINKEDIENVIDEFLREEGNLLFREEFKLLSPKERSIAVAIGTGQISRIADIANAVGETRNVVLRFLNYLQDKNIVIKQDKNYFLDDPIFEEWIKRRYGE